MNGRASIPPSYRFDHRLILEAQSGDARAIEYLVTEHPPVRALIGALRRSVDPFNIAPAEMEAAARLAVLEALGGFDGERGVMFTTYAYHFIRGAMLAELYPYVERRRETKVGAQRLRVVSLDQAFDAHDSEGSGSYESDLLRRDPEYGIEPGYAEVEDGLPDAVRAFVAGLPDSQRAIVEAVFWGEQTHSEIAAEHGVSRPAITRALTRVCVRGVKELAEHRHGLAA